MKMKIHTENFGGNMHDTATAINKLGLAEYLVQMDYSGGITLAVFKMPAEMVHEIRRNRPSYTADPHHDDPREA